MFKLMNFNKLFFIAVTILLLSQNASIGGQNDKATSIEKAGDYYLEKGEIQKAIKKYSEAIEKDKNNTRLYRSRAFAYVLIGEYDQALHDDQVALSLDPRNPDIHASIGLLFISKNNIKSAIYHFNNGINLLENNSSNGSLLFWHRGIAFERIAECQNAIEDFEKSLDSAPESSRSFIKNHIAWVLATCPDDNIRNGVKALEMVTIEEGKEISHDIYKILAAAFAETGDYKKAIKNQEAAFELLKKSKVDYAPNQDEKERNLADYAMQLKSYKSNKPWRLNNQIKN